MKTLSLIKKQIPESLKCKIKYLFNPPEESEWVYEGTEKSVYIFLGGYYQNLGDMAITLAQIQFLKDTFPDRRIVPVPSTRTYEAVHVLKKHIHTDDLITLAGGGNMDELYPSLENARRYVIRTFQNHRIVSFPQTIHFSNTKAGEAFVSKSYSIYKRAKKLTVFARESQSFQVMKQVFPTLDIGIAPDIVLYLNREEPKLQRKNIVCCFRSDIESSIEGSAKRKILGQLEKIYKDRLFITDTVDVAIGDCTPQRAESTLNAFLNIIKSAECVVTDRLHCMIFCEITGTPCIAFDNSNHKISALYNDWLKNSNYIVFRNEMLIEIREEIEQLSQLKYNKKQDLSVQFEILRNKCLTI